MEPKVIKTKAEYEEAMREIEKLSVLDFSSASPKAEKLKLLATLVQTYEKAKFKFDLPDPIDAIRFRMEEQELQQNDLIPFIGSKSKVSEVLARKRPLTLAMIRALITGLGIPPEVLIQQDKTEEVSSTSWSKALLKEISNRGWISEGALKKPEDALNVFFAPLVAKNRSVEVFWRKSLHHSNQESQKEYLLAWTARILNRSTKLSIGHLKISSFSDFTKELAQLSRFSQGPLMAQELLNKYGIKLIVESALPGSKLDGAAMLDQDGIPVIGLTLRYDRIDYFWFTLLHEVVHACKHLKQPNDSFFDDLEGVILSDSREQEADSLSKEAFIPRAKWSRSKAFTQRSLSAIMELSNELKVHPAIVAGRLRHELRDYTIFSDLIGQGEIRKLFSGK